MKNKKLQWGIIITLVLITLFLIYWFGIREPKPDIPGDKPHKDPGGGGGGGGTGNGGTGTPPAAVFPLQEGMQGDSVKSVQNKLKNCFKYTAISPTGLLDKDTKYALGAQGYPLPMSKSQWNMFMAKTC